MFILDFDDTLFDTHALKTILAESAGEIQADELKKLLFADAFLFLNYLKSNNKKLILLSLGDADWQNKKLDAAGIKGLFDEVVVTADAKEAALEKILNGVSKEKEVWFINDKIEETKRIIQHFPRLKPVFKMSLKFSEDQYKQTLIPSFSTLTQIKNYVAGELK